MDNKVKVQVRSVYGKDLVYPANALAESFTQLTGQKTFSHAQLQVIECMGFEVTSKATEWRVK